MNLAGVFPGQGSQSLGMLSELAANYSSIESDFLQVSDSLGYDLWKLVQEGPESQLNQTVYTQVAMLTADVAVYNLLKKQGFAKPQMMAGHSLGEYAALVCSEALTLVDAAKLVSKRGQLMQNTVPLGRGAMAAIVGLTNEQVEEICREASNADIQVSPANYNAVGQIVIAGHSESVSKAIQLAEKKQARLTKLIPVSVPCHCPLLTEAAENFEEFLIKTTFNIPNTAVISNVDLSIYRSISQIRNLLKEQLYRPVRWVETIQLMKKNGISTVIEYGPGKVLNGLIKRIERDMNTISVNDQASLNHAKQQIQSIA